MVKQYQIGNSFVTIVGKTYEEIDAKKKKIENEIGILQDKPVKKVAPVKRKRRTKAEIKAEQMAEEAMSEVSAIEAEED